MVVSRRLPYLYDPDCFMFAYMYGLSLVKEFGQLRMDKEIITQISIDGKELPYFRPFSLHQNFNTHHSFELIVNQDALAAQGHTLQSPQDYIGKSIGVALRWAKG